MIKSLILEIKEARELAKLAKKLKTLKVVGRGLLTVDVKEITESKEFKRSTELASGIVPIR